MMNSQKYISLVIFNFIFACSCNSSGRVNGTENIQCLSIRRENIEIGGPQYCNCTFKIFRRSYTKSNLKLTSFLKKLKAWSCPQFEDECKNRHFDFNHFTFLVYEKFCNTSNFEKLCGQKENASGSENESSSVERNTEASKSLKVFLGEQTFESACLQLHMYEDEKLYYEVARPLLSFCGSVWCGFNNTFQSPSTWMCLPTRCRASVIFIMAFCGILALAIIVANITIIVVILRNSQFPTSQLIYKLSLAFADILVGIFVAPSFIITLYTFYVSPYQRKMKIIQDYEMVHKTMLNSTSTTLDHDTDTYHYRPEITQQYRSFFGFITAFSLLNSVLTLMFASYDRFRFISNPLGYSKEDATRFAKYVTLGLWVGSALIALLPVIVQGLGPYRIVAGGVLISLTSEMSVYKLGTALMLPFIVMWILTITVNIILIRQLNLRKKLKSNFRSGQTSTEMQLSKTLTVMIGVFTACILPAIILIFVPDFVPSVNPYNIYQFSVGAASSFLAAELAASILLVSNSLWNAFIYSIRNKRFRTDATSLYCAAASALGLIELSRIIFEGFGKGLFNCVKRGSDKNKKVTSNTAQSTLG